MNYIEITVKLLIIMVLSALIGFDREMRHKPAGIKTHILVGMGSAVFMMVSIYMYQAFAGKVQVDPGQDRCAGCYRHRIPGCRYYNPVTGVCAWIDNSGQPVDGFRYRLSRGLRNVLSCNYFNSDCHDSFSCDQQACLFFWTGS